jgi:hypothetical protein
MVNHNPIAATVTGPTPAFRTSADLYFRQIEEQAADTSAEQIILSAEGFSGHPNVLLYGSEAEFRSAEAHYVTRVRELLNPHEVQIVAYLRRQDYWLDSMANQRIKLEGMNSGPRFLSIEQFYALMKPRLNYLASLAAWADQFGWSNIIVRPYERRQLYNCTVVDDFMRQVDPGYDPAEYAQNTASGSNPGLSRDVLEYKIRLNSIDRPEHKRRFLEIMLQEISEEMGGEHYPLVHSALRLEIAREYGPVNREISRTFLDGGALFCEDWSTGGESRSYSGLSPQTEQAISDQLQRKATSIRGLAIYLRVLASSKLHRSLPWLYLLARRLRSERILFGRR